MITTALVTELPLMALVVFAGLAWAALMTVAVPNFAKRIVESER